MKKTHSLIAVLCSVLALAFVAAVCFRGARRPFQDRGLGDIPATRRIDGPLFRSRGFTSYPTGRKTEELAIADFNRDSFLDVAACNSYHAVEPAGGDVSFFRGVGGGRLSAESRLRVGNYTEGIASGDLDGDGFLDLVAANYSAGSLSVLLGGPGGPLRSGETLELGREIGPRDVVAYDVDADGRLDVVFCGMDADVVGVARGRGDGTFTLQTPPTPVGEGPEVIALGLLDGDSVMDLVTANRDADTLTVLHGGSGAFQLAATIPTARRPRYVATVDLDGDGFDDLLSASHRDGKTELFRNLGGEGFGAPLALSIPGTRGAIYLAVGDVDGDGERDIAVSLHLSGYVAIFPGRGGFSFGEPQLIPIGLSALGVAIADLSGDGRMDLVVGNPLADRLQVYLAEP